MIAIIDYQMGNIHSVRKALESLGAKTRLAHKPGDLASCGKIVLPGVGAFADAMKELNKKGFSEALRAQIRNKKNFLGICLGMQLLFEESQEAKRTKGLGILRGSVEKFRGRPGLKVPHMGWNQLRHAPRVLRPALKRTTRNAQRLTPNAQRKTQDACPLLKGVPDGSYVYFCHSYYPAPEDRKVIAATTDYGIEFASLVWQENCFGVQFHPEKSQRVGMRILKNFVEL
jgi:glutamine amidotransferase